MQKKLSTVGKTSLTDIPNIFTAFIDPANVHFDTKIDLLSDLEADILTFIGFTCENLGNPRWPPSTILIKWNPL